jgi:hypothetical protein
MPPAFAITCVALRSLGLLPGLALVLNPSSSHPSIQPCPLPLAGLNQCAGLRSPYPAAAQGGGELHGGEGGATQLLAPAGAMISPGGLGTLLVGGSTGAVGGSSGGGGGGGGGGGCTTLRRVNQRLLDWACPACTLHNPKAAHKCGACRTPRPRDAALVLPDASPQPPLATSAQPPHNRPHSSSADGHGVLLTGDQPVNRGSAAGAAAPTATTNAAVGHRKRSHTSASGEEEEEEAVGEEGKSQQPAAKRTSSPGPAGAVAGGGGGDASRERAAAAGSAARGTTRKAGSAAQSVGDNKTVALPLASSTKVGAAATAGKGGGKLAKSGSGVELVPVAPQQGGGGGGGTMVAAGGSKRAPAPAAGHKRAPSRASTPGPSQPRKRAAAGTATPCAEAAGSKRTAVAITAAATPCVGQSAGASGSKQANTAGSRSARGAKLAGVATARDKDEGGKEGTRAVTPLAASPAVAAGEVRGIVGDAGPGSLTGAQQGVGMTGGSKSGWSGAGSWVLLASGLDEADKAALKSLARAAGECEAAGWMKVFALY